MTLEFSGNLSGHLLSVFRAATHVSIVATDVNGLITLFNAGAENLLGYRSQEMVGLLTPEAFHLRPELEQRGKLLSAQCKRPIHGFAVFVETARLGEGEAREWTYVRKDGSHVPVFLTVSAITDDDGRCTGFLGIAVNISDLKHVEGDLRQSQMRLQVFVDHAPAAVAMLDREMCLLLVSKRWLDDFGLAGRNIIGKKLHKVFPDTPPHWKVAHARCQKGETVRLDYDVLPREDGSIDYLRWEMLPWREPPGEVGGVVLLTEFITDRVLAERRLFFNEAKLNAVVETAVDGIITTLADGTIELINRAALKIFGYSRDEVIGKDVSMLMPEPYRSKHAGLVRNYLNSGKGNIIGLGGREVPGQRKDGSIVPLELAVNEMRLGEVRMFTCILRNITERVQAREALLKVNAKLAQKQQALDIDLKAASLIQHALLPPEQPVSGDRLDIAWRFIPSDRLGGDIFNIVELDGSRLGLYIMDVSGHGVPSALLTVLVHQAMLPGVGILTRPRSDGVAAILPPRQVMGILDGEEYFERFEKYLTMFYMVLDTRTGFFQYCNAGHPPPLILRKEGEIIELDIGGSILGLGSQEPFEQGEGVLTSGDILLLYTDGCTEHLDPRGVQFGEGRLKSHLTECRGAAAEVVVAYLAKAIHRHGEGASVADDLSLLCIRFCAP